MTAVSPPTQNPLQIPVALLANAAANLPPPPPSSDSSTSLKKTAEEVEKEFAKLKEQRDQFLKQGHPEASLIGRLPANASLNRGTIVPHDHTLVPVQNAYHNASYAFEGAYIQTQSPVKTIKNTFWQMVYEQRAQTIVMLNELSEPGIEAYWPKKVGQEATFKAVKVKLLEHTHKEVPGEKRPAKFDSRKLLVTGKDYALEVVHFHYSNWIDGRAPHEKGLLWLVEKVNRVQAKSIAPIVVHCFAGVGRTGAFTLLHKSIKDIKHGKKIDIQELVAYQRHPQTGRSPYMVTKLQYQAAYKILHNFKKGFQLSTFLNRLEECVQKKMDTDLSSLLNKMDTLFGKEDRSKLHRCLYDICNKAWKTKSLREKLKQQDFARKAMLDPNFDPKLKIAAIKLFMQMLKKA